MSIMSSRALNGLNSISLWFAGAAVLMMTVLGGLDVIGTAFLGRPIAGTYEATETLLVITAFLALGFLHQDRAHVAVEVFFWRMGSVARRLIDVLTLVLMGAYFGLMAWQGWIKAFESWSIGEYSVGLVQFPIYPSRFALAIGTSLAALNCALDLVFGARYRGDAAAAGGSVS